MHGLGEIDDGRIKFEWDALRERRLVIIPTFEMSSEPIFRAVRKAGPAQYYRESLDLPTEPPDPDGINFFVEVESSIGSLIDGSSALAYVHFYSEEGYLAVTPETAETVFGESVVDLLARSFLRCTSQDILRMRRHRHGVGIFLEALRHLDSLGATMRWPSSVML